MQPLYTTRSRRRSTTSIICAFPTSIIGWFVETQLIIHQFEPLEHLPPRPMPWNNNIKVFVTYATSGTEIASLELDPCQSAQDPTKMPSTNARNVTSLLPCFLFHGWPSMVDTCGRCMEVHVTVVVGSVLLVVRTRRSLFLGIDRY